MIDADLEGELQNWALWRCAGGWGYTDGSGDLVCDYSPVETRYREARVPVLSGAAGDVEDIVSKIHSDQRIALHAHYLRMDITVKASSREPVSVKARSIPPSFSQRQIARMLGVAERTYSRWLTDGRSAVGAALAEKRRGFAVA